MEKTVRVAVTGGAGQIAYSLLFRIASGELFGPNTSVILHILEIPQAMQALEGVTMELNDCAYPTLKEIVVGSDPKKVFEGIDYAFLVGAFPRGPGMERNDLLQKNANIFIEQGKALNEVASKEAKILVVGNPCNTNCWIAMKCAPTIPKENFFAMTMLDQNRARAQIAIKANVPVSDVTKVVIWGNHSSTQVPDFFNGEVQGKGTLDVIDDPSWLEGEFISKVQKRGSEIIQARGKSSAASAANAAIDAMKSILHATPSDDAFSMGIISKGNPYGVDEDLIFSYPCRSEGKGDCLIAKGWKFNAFLEEKLALTIKELQDEKLAVEGLL